MGVGRARADSVAGAALLPRAGSGLCGYRRARTLGAQLDRSHRRVARRILSVPVRPSGLFVSSDVGVRRLAGTQGSGHSGCALAHQYLAACRRLHLDAGDQLRSGDAALERRGSAEQRRRRARRSHRSRHRAWLEFSRCDPVAAGFMAGRRRAVPGRVLVRSHGQARGVGFANHRLGAHQDRAAPRAGFGTAAQAGAARSGARGAEESGEPAAAAHRGGSARAAEERPRGARAASAAVRCTQVERTAGVVPAR